jgi:hypothetical protein
VTKKHESVNKVGAHEASAAGYKDALSLGRRNKLDRGEARQSGVGDGIGVGMIDRLGLVYGAVFSKFCMLLFLVSDGGFAVVGGGDVVGTQIERSEIIERDAGVETKAVKTD